MDKFSEWLEMYYDDNYMPGWHKPTAWVSVGILVGVILMLGVM